MIIAAEDDHLLIRNSWGSRPGCSGPAGRRSSRGRCSAGSLGEGPCPLLLDTRDAGSRGSENGHLATTWRRTAADRGSRQAADDRFVTRIRAVHRESDGTYGVPRITAELRDRAFAAGEPNRSTRLKCPRSPRLQTTQFQPSRGA
ncbi:IS3 family transposase [Streptomyces sp. AC512_CC834]|uniref:IS3 family transposase n=1 Tax=Streptomyces sp. AC512_CC834 TaxID=2823691 RepID=UPI0035B14813